MFAPAVYFLAILRAGPCMAVNREFAYILFMCLLFCDWVLSFWCPSTAFSVPWAAFELFLAPLHYFGTPWAAMELAMVCLGTFGSSSKKSEIQF